MSIEISLINSIGKLTIPMIVLLLFTTGGCKKFREYHREPEIESLRQGFKTSAAMGYCASLAYSFFKGEPLPDNVLIQSEKRDSKSVAGILTASLSESYPLPFNGNSGQITIAGVWEMNEGYISILFTDINIIDAKFEFKGLHSIPISETAEGELFTAFAEQDIITGEGSDTLLNINFTNPQISRETDRLNQTVPENIFAAVKQNVWFVKIEQNNTPSDIYDDHFTISGGGQIAEVESNTGGIIYHALIGAEFSPAVCNLNPTAGTGFIQNIKAGENTDLGHISLSFKESCNGRAYVEFSTGKYLGSNRQEISLSFN